MLMNFVEILREMTREHGSLAGVDFKDHLSQSIEQGDDPRQYLNEYWLRVSDHFMCRNEDDFTIMFQLDEIAIGILDGVGAFFEDICDRTDESILTLFHDFSQTDQATMPEPRLTPYDITSIKRIVEETEKLYVAIRHRNIESSYLSRFEDNYRRVVPRLVNAFSVESLSRYFIDHFGVAEERAVDFAVFINTNLDLEPIRDNRVS